MYDLLEQNGCGRVLLVDGGGSVRRALVDAELARLATQNEWEGLVIYGACAADDSGRAGYRHSGDAAIPAGAAGSCIGESDVRVNFGGMTFFPPAIISMLTTQDYPSEDPLDIE